MLSIPHLIIIFVVALIIFGPEKLPELARNMGKLMAEFRRATTDLRGTFETHMRDLERETSDRRIDSVRPPATAAAPSPTNPAEIVAAPGTVPASAPHEAAVASASPPAAGQPLGTPSATTESPFTPDTPMAFPDDPEELIRQAEAQIARERADELENPERVSDGAIGKP
ncbi:MAG: Sec-independent protein translocase subunit TatA/TatB [Candidatus Acidiferrales bacterium]